MQRLILLSVVAIGIFWFASMRIGTSWGDDWAMYVHHAKNITEGKAYGDTGLIYNPDYPTYAPKTYPPGFPLILAPFYAAFGIDYNVLKVPVILSFIAALFIFIITYRKEFSPLSLLLLVIFLGLNPYCWEFKDSILSDFPFLLSVMLCAWVINKYSGSIGLRQAVLIGILVYISYSIRPLGALFLPAIFLADLISKRTITKSFLIATACFTGLALMQYLLLPKDNSYALMMESAYKGKSVTEIWDTVHNGFKFYRWASADFWLVGEDRSAWMKQARLFTNIFLLLMFVGLIVRMVRKISAVEVFVILYILVVLFFPGFQGARYFIPLLPLFFVYAFGLFEKIRLVFIRYIPFAVLLIPMLLFYSMSYKKAEWKNIDYGIHKKPAQELFTYVKENTPEDAVFVIGKPRAFSLFTDRKAAVYHTPENKNDLLTYMKSISTDYVVTGILDYGYFNGWVNGDTTDFHFEYENEYFRLFKTKF